MLKSEQETVTNETMTKLVLKSQKGFSLIEILIALTLLVVVGGFVAGKVYDQYQEGLKSSALINMKNIEERLKEFRRKCGFYPTTDQGLEALVTKPTGGRECRDYPPSGFIEGDQVPKDPWDRDYNFESDGKVFNIYSYGNDGEAGGEGADADIYLKAPAKGAESSEEPTTPSASNTNASESAQE